MFHRLLNNPVLTLLSLNVLVERWRSRLLFGGCSVPISAETPATLRGFHSFLSSPTKWQDSTSNRSRSVPSKSFLICHQSSYNSMLYSLATGSIVKHPTGRPAILLSKTPFSNPLSLGICTSVRRKDINIFMGFCNHYKKQKRMGRSLFVASLSLLTNVLSTTQITLCRTMRE
jgi:hypothetical protein